MKSGEAVGSDNRTVDVWKKGADSDCLPSSLRVRKRLRRIEALWCPFLGRR